MRLCEAGDAFQHEDSLIFKSQYSVESNDYIYVFGEGNSGPRSDEKINADKIKKVINYISCKDRQEMGKILESGIIMNYFDYT